MLKIILEYVLWTVAALILGIGYMSLVLGPPPEETNAISFFVSKIYFIGLIHVGGIIGAILAALFILFDVFYLKKKWQSFEPFFALRAVSMLCLLIVIGVLHHLLEKTFDVI